MPLAAAFVEEAASPALPPARDGRPRARAATAFFAFLACHVASFPPAPVDGRRARTAGDRPLRYVVLRVGDATVVAPRPLLAIAPPGPNYILLPDAARAAPPPLATVPKHPALDLRYAYSTAAPEALPTPLAPPPPPPPAPLAPGPPRPRTKLAATALRALVAPFRRDHATAACVTPFACD